MLKRYLLIAAMAALMAACSSTRVNPPIEGEQAGQAGAFGAGADQSAVTQVQAGASSLDAQGPVGVPRIIFFDFDSYVIKPEYQTVVDQQGRFLQAHPDRHVVLEGNTDARGSREYNLALGQKRAEAVRHALVLIGVNDNQIEAVSFGAENPAESGATEDAYAQNRRVEFHYR